MPDAKKGILVFLTVTLCGCSLSSSLSDIHVDQNMISTVGSQFVAFSDTGIYFLNENDEMFFKEDGKANVSLGYINYVDGRKANVYSSGYSADQEVYMHSLGIGGEYYDGRIYTVYEHQSTSGGLTYELCSLDEKGRDLQSHITFEYMPGSFYITEGKVYVCTLDTEGQKGYLSVYDDAFKEIETTEYDQVNDYPEGFYVVDGEVKVPGSAAVYDYGDVQLSRRSQPVEGTDTSYQITGIYDRGDVHVELENRIIEFVNDQYFYAYYFNLTDTPMEQVYERYNLDGTLDTSIRIADWLETDETISSMDFGSMINLRNEDQTFGYSKQGLFTCDFSSGKCEYLYEN